MKTTYQTAISYIHSIESYASDLAYSSVQNLLRHSPQILTIIGIAGLTPIAYRYTQFNERIKECTKISTDIQQNPIYLMDKLIKSGLAFSHYKHESDMALFNAVLAETNNIKNSYISLQESHIEGITHYASYI
jgi:hypothetical protein